MGYGAWTGSTYDARQQAARAAGYTSAFTHDEDIRAGRKAAGIDPLNDPRRKAGPKSKYAGRVVREVCISEEHPDPTAIAVVFDVTGSMGELPRIVQKKLPLLQGRLTDQGYADDPQILFGATGDARSDDFPLQMGQFESDNRGDEQLEALYLEGNGGGQGSETYELAALYLAAASVLEPFEQFGKKGYLFTVGDERPAGVVQKEYHGYRQHTWKSLTGLPLETDVDAATVVALVTEKFEWFHFVVDSTKFGGMYGTDHALGAWQGLLGDRAQVLGEPEALPEAIAAIVGVMEGKIDRATAKRDVGNALLLTA
jgi:hypothetical protein